jgi:hypothetical protein
MGLLESFGGIYGAETLEKLQITVVLDAGQASMGLKELRDSVLEGGQEFGKYALAAGEIIGPIVAAGIAMFEASVAAGQYAHEISDLQVITGLSSRYLQELKYACDANLIGFGAVSNAVMFFQKHLGDLDSPTSQTAKGLERLNIDAKNADGSFRSMDSLLPQVISALKNVRDPTERAGLAMELFGRNTAEVTKLIDLGSDGIARYGLEAEKLGIILGPDEQAKADAYAKELAKINLELQAMWRELGEDLIPVMEDLLPIVQDDVIPIIKDLSAAFEVLILDIRGAIAAWHEFEAHLPIVGGLLYSQEQADKETAAVLQGVGSSAAYKALTGQGAAAAKTGSVTSRSKELYAQLHGTEYGVKAGVTQINNIQMVQQTDAQLQTTIKKISQGFSVALGNLV